MTLLHMPHSCGQVRGSEYLGHVFIMVKVERQVETCLATEGLGSELTHSLLPTCQSKFMARSGISGAWK